MPKVVMSIPRLGVKPGGFERNKEIYVMSFTSDLRTVAGPRLMEVIAAYNETLPNVMPDIASKALVEFILMAVSNTFQRIRPEQPVSLSGSGILLYPNLDPNGLLASHFVVMEDDAGKRNLGELLDNLFSSPHVRALVQNLQVAVTPQAIAALMSFLVSNLPALLKKNRDDFLFAHSHSGFDFDRYGCMPGSDVCDFDLGNDRIYCTLRIAVH